VYDIRVCRSSDLTFAVSASDNAVRVYSLETQQITSNLISPDCSITDFVYDDENSILVSSNKGTSVCKWDIRSNSIASCFNSIIIIMY